MPLFEYKCSECGNVVELLQKSSDLPPTICESCKKLNTMEKQISLGSFQLKGDGWYKDLYSSPKKS